MPLGIVIPVLNRRDNLSAALLSLARQTSTDFILVVVEGGSTDGTAELLDALAVDPFWSNRLRVITPAEGSVENPIAQARNAGARALPDDVTTMLMLDSDIVLPSDFLAGCLRTRRDDHTVVFAQVHWLGPADRDEVKDSIERDAVDALRARTGAAAVGAAIPMPMIEDGTLIGPEIRFSLFGGVGPSHNRATPMRPYWMVAPNSMWPRSLFDEIGGFDESIAGHGVHDYELGMRMAAAGVRAVGVEELWGVHLWHAKSDSDRPIDDAVAASVTEQGVAADMFMMFRRGAAGELATP